MGPESILNVKQHADIRDILLKKTLLDIQRLGRAFDGVFTEVIRISLRKYPSIGKNLVGISGNSGIFSIRQELISSGSDHVLSLEKSPQHAKIIQKMLDSDNFYLRDNAEWALGVVTGDNAKYIYSSKQGGLRPVVKGKDLSPFKVHKPQNFIDFQPLNFSNV